MFFFGGTKKNNAVSRLGSHQVEGFGVGVDHHDDDDDDDDSRDHCHW